MGDEGEKEHVPVPGADDYFAKNAVVAQLEPAAPEPLEPQPGATARQDFSAFTTSPLASPSPLSPASPASPTARSGRLALYLFLLVSLCFAGVTSLLVTGVLTAPASVTIKVTPQVVVREGTISLHVVMGAPSSNGQIPVQAADATSNPVSATVSIAPVIVQARAAGGQVTFYNIAPYAQFIPGRSLLIARGGVEFRTLSGILVPAGNAPAQGSAVVATQAVVAGANGNIPAGSISMVCCTGALYNGVYARNEHPFSGGQDSGPQYVVEQADISRAQEQVVAEPTSAAQQAITAHIPSGARLVRAPSCSPHIWASAPVGTRTQQVRVSVRVECHALFYIRQDASWRVGVLFAQQVEQVLGPHYRQLGQVTLLSDPTPSGTGADNAVLSFQVRGAWVYLLERGAFERLLPQVAGKRWVDGSRLLERVPGVWRLSLAPPVDTLPTDDRRIVLQVAPPAGPGQV